MDHYLPLLPMVEDEEKEAVHRSEEDDDADQMKKKKKKRRIEREWFLFCRPRFPFHLCYLDDLSYENTDPTELKVDTSNFTSGHLCSIGTCNGLLCLGDLYRDRNPVYIIDPINNKFLTIRSSPDPQFGEVDKLGFMSGFGYDHVSGVYKVLRLSGGGWEPFDDEMECTICTVHPEHGATGWRFLDPVRYRLVTEGRSGVFFRGKLYFLLINNCCDGFFVGILCFDVAKEKFSEIPGPAQLNGKWISFDLLHMDLFEDKLVLVFCNSLEGLLRIWEVNDDSSWPLLFDIPFDRTENFYRIKLLKQMPDGCLLMYDRYSGELISYDCRVKEPKHIILFGHLKRYDVFPFTPDIKFDVTTCGDGTVRLSEVQDERGCYVDAWSSNFVPYGDPVFCNTFRDP
ncbi:hypothetical protein QJS04_geneDACA021882 [Acorus gramineus]|uniref:F-box associated beta-propeller type 3 domain-containing protein n=1 Tax=Acorus gramineus TaxID=55184 RepID=A0AAV9AJ98_ACOGR|nr:hypothetical protein QJS04_geneDACA021882 [Acorus gramineus]